MRMDDGLETTMKETAATGGALMVWYSGSREGKIKTWLGGGKSRDGNGSGRAITRPPAKRLRVEICTRTHG
jgi:hypothetical protein